MSELPIPRHVDKTYLECNSPACRRPNGKNRLIHKDKETLHLGQNATVSIVRTGYAANTTHGERESRNEEACEYYKLG